MKIKLYSGPSIEPLTLNELKLHLRLTSGEFSDNIDLTQSIAPGSHATTTGYALVGAGIDVLGYSAIVSLVSGLNQATGTVDVKIQESDDDVSAHYTDWTGGAFTQITTTNDNATYEMAYSGVKQFIRVVARVLLAPCEFGVNVLRNVATGDEDDLLAALISTARQQVEHNTRRQLITATWDYYLDNFPKYNYIKIPFGNLQYAEPSDMTVTYRLTDGSTVTMNVGTDYLVETNGEQCGRIVLPYGMVWPQILLYPSNPITIRFKCGYGDTADKVPAKIKTAMKMLSANMYEDRGETEYSSRSVENPLFDRLLASYRLWDEFDEVT
jgi:uncharacterized phiE125 gp8 family phage protein